MHGWQNQPPKQDALGPLHPTTSLDASPPKRFAKFGCLQVVICQRMVAAEQSKQDRLGRLDDAFRGIVERFYVHVWHHD